jgi:spermidine synthase
MAAAARAPSHQIMTAWVAAALLFPSGYCALVYEITWLRSLRLVFGASTPASAMVLACFMGGLGLGGLVLGRRADAARSPLLLYAGLEAAIALLAAVSPHLIDGVRWAYLELRSGGVVELGPFSTNAIRGVLSAVVLVPPAFLMGGTLPVLVRLVEEVSDRGRRFVGLLYGANSLGAVAGALLTTFLFIEAFGLRSTLWLAAATNLLIAIAAVGASILLPALGSTKRATRPAAEESAWARATPSAPVPLVLVSAGVVGFAFFLMELVWYRMLAPLLGGSSYTLGMILAVALLGIGAGGLLYAMGSRERRPTLRSFATACALESLLLVVPYAIGDHLAILAIWLRTLGELGFGYLIASWSLVTAVVVLPASVVAGYQFPLLVAILGGGERRVGRHVGATYASNTVGAIAGSLAGGFWLIPRVGAPELWLAASLLLAALALVAQAAAMRTAAGRPDSARGAALPIGLAVLTALLCLTVGPSAVWRHQAIGAGRVALPANANELEEMRRRLRRAIRWEADGMESSLAATSENGYALLINGKSDGHARGDAATTVMMPVIGALLHGEPQRGLVIGLGSGASAGWLARIDSIENVDIVEIEPLVARFARMCAAINYDALSNPKVRLEVGDGREFLLTTARRYDLILSEPSNPYRAGVSSLFTREFYAAAAERLRPGGLFLQWLQAYEADATVIRAVLATLRAVYPHVEIWEVKSNADLLLVASRDPIVHDVARMKEQLARPPFSQALALTWGVADIEGLYVGYVASDALASRVGSEGAIVETDDHPHVEFAFARLMGRSTEFRVEQLRRAARELGADRPTTRNGTIDWSGVEDARAAWFAFEGLAPGRVRLAIGDDTSRGAASRIRARQAYSNGRMAEALRHWNSQTEPPSAHLDLLLVAETLAEAADPEALDWADRLERISRIEANAVRAAYALAQQRVDEAGRHLEHVFEGLRTQPWVYEGIVERSATRAVEIATRRSAAGRRIFDALAEPFSLALFDRGRNSTRIELAAVLDFPALCHSALAPLEPHFPWERKLLTYRRDCYEATDDPRAVSAGEDLDSFTGRATLAWPVEIP